MISIGEQLNRTNKRRLRRFRYRCRITFSVRGVSYRGLSSNFSLEGLFIRTSAPVQTGALLDIVIHYPNDLTSRIQGQVIRVTKEASRSTADNGEGNGEKGIGIRVLRKDSLYLHFIHSLIENEEKDVLGQFLFADTASECRAKDPVLQKRCHLFDVNALAVVDHSAGGKLLGKAWFEARMRNNTDHVFREPVVVFMTTHDCACLNNEIPDIGALMMSSPQNNSYWNPGEIITLTSEIDSSAEDCMHYELAFFDYLIRILNIPVEEPVTIDDFIKTIWLGSPHLVADTPEGLGIYHPYLSKP